MLNLPKFLFLNGPPGSGKSTLATLLCNTHPQLWRESFAEPIRQMLYSVFFPEEGPINYSFDLRDGEVKKRLIFGEESPRITIRDVMISFSERWMKDEFGKEIFGRLCLKRCLEQEDFYPHFVIDDSGFESEARYIVAKVGPENCHLIRLHRRGCSFFGDSRQYIYLDGVQSLDLHNDGPPDEMLATLQLEMGTL